MMSDDEPLLDPSDERVTNHPDIKPRLDRLRAMTPSPQRPAWHLPRHVWAYGLRDYPTELGGQAYVDKLLDYNQYGWPVTANTQLTCQGTETEYHAKIRHIAEGLRLMEQRIEKGFIWGPFFDDRLHEFPFTETALGQDPLNWPLFYKQEPGKVRLLVNLSHKAVGGSFNDQIAQEEKTVHVSAL